MEKNFTPKDVLALGMPSGPHIPEMTRIANDLQRLRADDLKHLLPAPKLPLQTGVVPHFFIDPKTQDEIANVAAVTDTMNEVVKTPVVKAAAVMPDACPAGPIGTIPVGGVVASTGIHPGMHSADICCSVALSVFEDEQCQDVLDRFHSLTHFGPGGRCDFPMSQRLRDLVLSNSITRGLIDTADSHMGTQGDGNHFAFVGSMRSTGKAALVTHHGSRGFGARVYKAGMRIAEKFRRQLSTETLKQNAWIPFDTDEGQAYWQALQIVREWTKENHRCLHDALGMPVVERFWNEHNFVFRKSDGLFYHAKGATPSFPGWAEDATDRAIIPLNLAEPILIVEQGNVDRALGFAPHGAGRNYSRSEHVRRGGADFDAETKGLDFRFFCGVPDTSELPSAYKDAASVRAQIERFGLAKVVDEVVPFGGIMAGDWQADAPWRKKK